MPDHKTMALPTTLSGFRLTRLADPMRLLRESLGPTGFALPSSIRMTIQYSGLLKNNELPNQVSSGVLQRKNAKTPVVRYDTNRGSREIHGRCLLCR